MQEQRNFDGWFAETCIILTFNKKPEYILIKLWDQFHKAKLTNLTKDWFSATKIQKLIRIASIRFQPVMT